MYPKSTSSVIPEVLLGLRLLDAGASSRLTFGRAQARLGSALTQSPTSMDLMFLSLTICLLIKLCREKRGSDEKTHLIMILRPFMIYIPFAGCFIRCPFKL